MEINYMAVLAAAVANFMLGWLWYGPIFGKPWKAMMGFTDNNMKAMKMKAMPAMVMGFVTAFLTAYVLAHFVLLFGASDVMGALELAFWTWLGFFATTLAGSVLWENKPISLYLLNASYYLVGLCISSLILALWK